MDQDTYFREIYVCRSWIYSKIKIKNKRIETSFVRKKDDKKLGNYRFMETDVMKNAREIFHYSKGNRGSLFILCCSVYFY